MANFLHAAATRGEVGRSSILDREVTFDREVVRRPHQRSERWIHPRVAKPENQSL